MRGLCELLCAVLILMVCCFSAATFDTLHRLQLKASFITKTGAFAEMLINVHRPCLKNND